MEDQLSIFSTSSYHCTLNVCDSEPCNKLQSMQKKDLPKKSSSDMHSSHCVFTFLPVLALKIAKQKFMWYRN